VRVLILHSRYRSGSASGENRVVEDEAFLLRRAGHAVEVWDPSAGDVRGASLARVGAGVVWSFSAGKETRRRIRAFGPDIVHVHNLFPMLSPVVLRSASAEGVPIVMTLHNYRLHCLPGTCFRDGKPCELCVGRVPVPGVVHRCYQGSMAASAVLATSLTVHRSARSFDRVSLYLAVSGFVRDLHLGAGMRSSRIRVKSNFAWPSERREGPGDAFAYVGRLSREKGVHTLIEAWKEVSARLVVVGDGPEAGELRASAPSNVEFLGEVRGEDVAALLKGVRALILPSLWYEPASRATLEAYAAGVPVIASRIGGFPELVDDGISGRLVPPGDARALADATRALMEEAGAERMGEGAHRTWRERYTPEHGLEALEEAYRAAIEGADRISDPGRGP
jgi:glycosyltransferase involved in cell wall biosynthesis